MSSAAQGDSSYVGWIPEQGDEVLLDARLDRPAVVCHVTRTSSVPVAYIEFTGPTTKGTRCAYELTRLMAAPWTF